eukprot:GHVP01052179.1.p1 GENE.GHVP01052179.1~~GHVP01052179.1.p1  ORF type:complete len:187 (+),score=31.32 GHVP01052179.1:19-579(+)
MSRFLVPASQIQSAASELLQCDFTKRESLNKTREAIKTLAKNAAFACMEQSSKALKINWDNFSTIVKKAVGTRWVEADSAPNCDQILVDDLFFDFINEIVTFLEDSLDLSPPDYNNAKFKFNITRAKFLRYASATWNPATQNSITQLPPTDSNCEKTENLINLLTELLEINRKISSFGLVATIQKI